MKKALLILFAALSLALCFAACADKNGGEKTTEPQVPLTEYGESPLLTIGFAEGWTAQKTDEGVMLVCDAQHCVFLVSKNISPGAITADEFKNSLEQFVAEAGGTMLANRKVSGVEMSAGKYTAAGGAKTLELRGGNGTSLFKVQVNINNSKADGSFLDSDEVTAMINSIVFK